MKARLSILIVTLLLILPSRVSGIGRISKYAGKE